MPYFNLLIVNTGQILSDATAPSRDAALGVFERELGIGLSFDDQGGPAPYLFEEWTDGPHWINPSTPVFEKK